MDWLGLANLRPFGHVAILRPFGHPSRVNSCIRSHELFLSARARGPALRPLAALGGRLPSGSCRRPLTSLPFFILFSLSPLVYVASLLGLRPSPLSFLVVFCSCPFSFLVSSLRLSLFFVAYPSSFIALASVLSLVLSVSPVQFSSLSVIRLRT